MRGMKNKSGKKIIWGVLGCANIARRRWIGAINQTKMGEVVAIASRSEEKARQWAGEMEIPRAYGSYEELLADGEVEAIFTALPNGLHREWVIKALEAGKHVLCDKPLGVNATEAEEMVAAAEGNHRLLMEGFMYQYHGQYEVMRRWMEQGRIGRLRMIRVGFSFLFDKPGDFRYDPKLGGGALLDLGCYCVHIARLLTQGQVRKVQAVSVMNDTGVDWTTTASLVFDGDITAVIDCSFGYAGGRFLHVAGTEGLICSYRPISHGEETEVILLNSNQEEIERVTVKESNLYTNCVDDFNERIVRGEFRPSPARDAIENMRVLDAIADAARK
jgi:xylose dehydrogenase (NAD/NADP)